MHVVFVCTGNICRSPMAERVAQAHAQRVGVVATFSSAGVSSEEAGNPMDRRAVDRLRAAGYDTSPHVATRVTDDELATADLLVALTPQHQRSLLQRGAAPERVALLTDFDPDATDGSGVPDPWYGPDSAFDDTLAAVEAAMPGLMARLGANAD